MSTDLPENKAAVKNVRKTCDFNCYREHLLLMVVTGDSQQSLVNLPPPHLKRKSFNFLDGLSAVRRISGDTSLNAPQSPQRLTGCDQAQPSISYVVV